MHILNDMGVSKLSANDWFFFYTELLLNTALILLLKIDQKKNKTASFQSHLQLNKSLYQIYLHSLSFSCM